MELQPIEHLPVTVQQTIEKNNGLGGADTQTARKEKNGLCIATSSLRRSSCEKHVKAARRFNREPCDAASGGSEFRLKISAASADDCGKPSG